LFVRANSVLRAARIHYAYLIWRFSLSVNRALIRYREPVMDMQLVQERIAGAAMEMFASACVISRLDSDLQGSRRTARRPCEPESGAVIPAAIVPSDQGSLPS
jgi:hypothetical protein